MLKRLKGSSNKGEVLKFLTDYLFIFLGTGTYTISVYSFTAPNNIAPGGVTGLVIVLHYIFPVLQIGIMVSLINIPLLIIGYKSLGRRFIIKTLVSTIIFTLMHDYIFPHFMPVYTGDIMLASLFGGVLTGVGLGLVFIKGGSTGGTDITNRLIQKKYPHISLGRIILTTDIIIITIAAIVFGNIESALYAIVAMFVASKAMDSIIYGADIGKMVLIVTMKPREMCEEVHKKISRGTTIIPAKGGYTGQEKTVILCAVKSNQFYRLKKVVYQVDEKAFMMVTTSTEVVGEGFKSLTSEF